MTPFEKVMGKSFIEYLLVADLKFLFPQMRMAGMIGKTPGFVQVAKAPYDFDGYFLDGGRYIAGEIKENAERSNGMRIIPPEKKGTGLQYHQLEALVKAYEAGAYVALVWNNGGEIGVLDGTFLKAAKSAMDTSLKAEKEGYPDTARGSRTLVWGNFKPVKMTGSGIPLWLFDKQ